MARRAQETAKKPDKAGWHARYGNWAQIASAAIAALGFTIVIYQIHTAATKASADALRAELADARKLYMSYSESTLKYPQLSEPNYDVLMKDRVEYTRYENFFSHMLYAYDDILNVMEQYGNEDESNLWFIAFERDLEPHMRYLCQIKDESFFAMYRTNMQEWLKEAKEQNCKTVQPLPARP